jgi:type I restriction enzyme S subunit
MSEWKTTTIGEGCVTFRSGGTPTAGWSEYYGGVIPFVTIEDMTACNKHLSSTRKTITEAGLSASAAWFVPSRHLLYSMYATLGKTRINTLPVATNQAIAAILPNPKRFDLSFLYYALSNLEQQVHRFTSQTTQANLNASIVKSFEIDHPSSIPEQRKIARILTTVDNLIEKTEALIEKYKSIKQGMMHDLFTRGVDSTGQLRPPYEDAPHLYKDSPLGWIPKEWEVDKFKNLTSILTCGLASTPPYVDEQNGVPFLSAQNVQRGRMSYHKYGYIPFDLHRNLTKYNKPRRGDILYTRVGYIGEAANVDVDWEFSFYVSLTLIRMRSGCSNFFYKHLLNGHDCKRLATRDVYVGGGVGNLNVNVVREFDMLVPGHREQDEIANRLDGIDELAAKEQKTLKKLHLTKTGLMQDLLTGKVRVNVDEAEEVTADV